MKTFIPVAAVAFVTGFISGFALFAWACFTSIKP